MFDAQFDTRPALRSIRQRRGAPAFAGNVLVALLATGTCAQLSGRSVGGSQGVLGAGHKVRAVVVALDVRDDALVATAEGSKPKPGRIDCSTITAAEYERTAHRRWKAGGLVSGLFLPSKATKHWLAAFRGEEETVFQRSRRNDSRVMAAVEPETGKRVKTVVNRGQVIGIRSAHGDTSRDRHESRQRGDDDAGRI